jgi:hypothetical protein
VVERMSAKKRNDNELLSRLCILSLSPSLFLSSHFLFALTDAAATELVGSSCAFFRKFSYFVFEYKNKKTGKQEKIVSSLIFFLLAYLDSRLDE